MASIIPHTYRRNGIYYARVLWPVFLSSSSGRRDLRISLKTNHAQDERVKLYGLLNSFHQLVDTLKSLDDSARSVQASEQIHAFVTPNKTPQTTRSPKIKSSGQKEKTETLDRTTDQNTQIEPSPFKCPEIALVDAMQAYIGMKQKSAWKGTKTASQGIYRLEQLIGLLGKELSCQSLTWQHTEQLETELYNRIDINSARKGRSKSTSVLSLSTAKSYLSLARSFLKYCYQRQWIQSDLSSGLGAQINGIKATKQSQSYKPFDMDDLAKIFNGSIYTHTELKRPVAIRDSYYWAPLIGAYYRYALKRDLSVTTQRHQNKGGDPLLCM